MLEELHNEIFENVSFTAMDKFEVLIRKTITKTVIFSEDNPNITTVSLKVTDLLQGLTSFSLSRGKEQSMVIGTETIIAITNALQFELDEGEAFLLFHIRNIGKFRKKESDLLNELKKLWQQYPDYAMEDREFSRALKSLMRDKFIQYRKGSIHLNPSFIIRYRI